MEVNTKYISIEKFNLQNATVNPLFTDISFRIPANKRFIIKAQLFGDAGGVAIPVLNWNYSFVPVLASHSNQWMNGVVAWFQNLSNPLTLATSGDFYVSTTISGIANALNDTTVTLQIYKTLPGADIVELFTQSFAEMIIYDL